MNFGTSEKNSEIIPQNPSKRLQQNLSLAFHSETSGTRLGYPESKEMSETNIRSKNEKSKISGIGMNGKSKRSDFAGTAQVKMGYSAKSIHQGQRSRLKLPFVESKSEINTKSMNDYSAQKGITDSLPFRNEKRIAQTIDVSKNDRRQKDISTRHNERIMSNYHSNSRPNNSEQEKLRKYANRKNYNGRDKRATYNIKTNGRTVIGKGGPILEFNNTSCRKSNINQQLFGDFKYGDRPKQILKARKLEGLIEFIVEWEEREDGFKPKNSVITNQELKEKDVEFLVNFYEGRLIFPDEFMSKRAYRGNRNSAGPGSRAQSYHSSHKKIAMGSGMKGRNFC